MIHIMRQFYEYGEPMSYCNVRVFTEGQSFTFRAEFATCGVCRARGSSLGELTLTLEEATALELAGAF